MKLRRTANKPIHGLGPHGKLPKGLMHAEGGSAGAHMPQRITSGHEDRNGYQDGAERRNGEHTGKAAKGDSRHRSGPEGNSKGSPPPGIGKGMGVRGSPDSHLGDAGRGGSGRHGKGDSFKGKSTSMTEEPNHNWFEKLGSN